MKIKLYLFLILLYWQVHPLVAQNYFTGEITYEIEIIPKSDTVDIDNVLKNELGTTAKYLITDGYYKSSYFKNDKLSYSYTYHDETKRMYDDYEDKPFITFRDSRKPNSQYSEPKILKDSTINVLDYKCYAVISNADFGTKTNYYSDDVKINFETFKDHEVGNWYRQMKEVDGALSLKSIIDYGNYYQIQTVVNIDEKKVSKEEFKLPESKKIAASYTALDKQVEMVQPTNEQIQCYQNKINSSKSINYNDPFTTYVNFLVTKEGSINHIRIYEADDYGFDKVAIDIIKSCGFKFTPGEISGEMVTSEVYFPIKFNN